MKKKIILTSIAIIALCLCLIAGSTYALFTTKTEVNIAVTAANLDIEATIVENTKQLRSLTDPTNVFTRTVFANGGEATFDNGVLKIERMTPGDGVYFEVKVRNIGNVAVKYNVKWDIAEDTYTDTEGNQHPWADVLDIKVLHDGKEFDGKYAYDDLGAPDSTATFVVMVIFKNGTAEHDNHYQDRRTDIQFTVEAVQDNGVDANGNLITTNK